MTFTAPAARYRSTAACEYSLPAPKDLLNSHAPLRIPGAAVPVGKKEPMPVGSSSRTARSKLNFTAAASSSLPSWNLMPLRSLKT